MSKKLNVLISFIRKDNSCEEDDYGWFTDLRFTDKDTTEPKDVECKIREAFEKYEDEYFEEYYD